MSFLSDESLAEDAAQESFLKAYCSLHTFRGDSAFSTWLYRITVNHCKDLLRKRAREKTQSWEAMMEEYGEPIQRLWMQEDPKSAGFQAEFVERLLSELPPDYRVILTLREMQGLSYEEMAGTLECTVELVKSRLRRAREALQKKLRHFLDAENVE